MTNSDGSPNETTIHFHGIREVGFSTEEVFGPWSDGVPFVNQCPLEAGKVFIHKFFAGLGSNFNAPPGINLKKLKQLKSFDLFV